MATQHTKSTRTKNETPHVQQHIPFSSRWFGAKNLPVLEFDLVFSLPVVEKGLKVNTCVLCQKQDQINYWDMKNTNSMEY